MKSFFQQRRSSAPYVDDSGPWKPARRMVEAVQRLVGDIRPVRQLAENGVIEAVERAAGKETAGHLRVAGLKGGQLIVEVDSAARLQELEFQRAGIMKKLKADPDAPRVVRLKFKIGRWKKT